MKLTGRVERGVAYNVVKLNVLMAIVIAISLVLHAYYEAPARPLAAFADAAQSSTS